MQSQKKIKMHKETNAKIGGGKGLCLHENHSVEQINEVKHTVFSTPIDILFSIHNIFISVSFAFRLCSVREVHFVEIVKLRKAYVLQQPKGIHHFAAAEGQLCG